MAVIKQYKTAKGIRYRVRYMKPDHTETSKRGFKRKRDAELWASSHVTVAIANDDYIDPGKGKVTVGQLYEAWYAGHRSLWKPSMAHTTEVSWRTHVKDTWQNVPIKNVTRSNVQRWISGLAGERSASTTLKAYGILKGVVDDALKDRRISRDPLEGIKLPRKPKRKSRRVYLTIPQLIAFADECRNAQERGEERRALILLLGFCGLRWGEAAALRVGDVDFLKHRIEVVGNVVRIGSNEIEGTPKSGQGRSVPMPRIVESALLEVCAGKAENDHVFLDPSGHTIKPQSVADLKGNRTWYVSALRRLGYLPEDMPSPHDLRHTAASIAVHAGANVKALQRMLGHASAAMTLDVYADLFDSDLDDVARMIDAGVEVETGIKTGQKPAKKSLIKK
ncbi:tyrosine-type recombinase/integrase [Bifidobacterium sp. ESL0784]|uniref:tyrosine-type recombinase/integrase n=1 Tax=Bifidobacterium sp. ESL0784 TaxID=2983231 RepID=UPI0023F85BDC|nr:site-specific integrase [Bifidobacterium sp. ESL0784]MDF7641757.1 tyrosine-type recombinase/integrase [Bifidobacterium sp. ESL0784]